jgi:integrase
VSKTRRARWVEIPEDLYDVLVDRLPAREDRDPAAPLFAGVQADKLRTAIGRACRDAAVPAFSPHALRHRRISLLHRQGVPWATIGERMGQRNLAVTANTYTHAMIDGTEVDRPNLLERVRTVVPPVVTSPLEITV